VSRNLCHTTCRHCGHELTLDEGPRLITVEDTGEHFIGTYLGMVVANASCPLCCAKYLAWLDGTNRTSHAYPSPIVIDGKYDVCDLSYRSTFNDEPGDDDMPAFEPVAEMRRLREENAALRAAVGELVEHLQESAEASKALVGTVERIQTDHRAERDVVLGIATRAIGVADASLEQLHKTNELPARMAAAIASHKAKP
jgi:hypothetical protein